MRTISVLIAATAIAALAGDEPQRIRLTVEREDTSVKGTAWRAVNPATVFGASDKLRFRVSSNFSGYLYVMNQGTSGAYEQLFPRSDTGADNRVEAGKEYVVPAGAGWFKVSGPPGQDVVYWVISPVEFSRQYKPLPPPPPKGEAPANMKPRCDDVVFRARGECIDDTAGVRAVKPGEKLPENIGSVAGATPRELLFFQDKGGTVLSSQTPFSGPVVYELRLAHK